MPDKSANVIPAVKPVVKPAVTVKPYKSPPFKIGMAALYDIKIISNDEYFNEVD